MLLWNPKIQNNNMKPTGENMFAKEDESSVNKGRQLQKELCCLETWKLVENMTKINDNYKGEIQ